MIGVIRPSSKATATPRSTLPKRVIDSSPQAALHSGTSARARATANSVRSLKLTFTPLALACWLSVVRKATSASQSRLAVRKNVGASR
jgi:hypothetical protein